MEPTYENIIESKIFKFVVGARKKEYSVHGAVLSNLSRPLSVLLTGPHREAKESRVDWPDVEEKTFVRFVEWAYTRTYKTEEPEIILDESNIGVPPTSNDANETTTSPGNKALEEPLYSLGSVQLPAAQPMGTNFCVNSACAYYNTVYDDPSPWGTSVLCLVCRESYTTTVCECQSVFSSCPNCASKTAKRDPSSCSRAQCSYYKRTGTKYTTSTSSQCPRCRHSYDTRICRKCKSVFSDCPRCYTTRSDTKRNALINKFVGGHAAAPTPASVFAPRKNTEACEDYTGVFLCHARLYVLGDTYDVPQLRALSLHRLHATLRDFTLYPRRLGDVAALARYVFENTAPGDGIRDMVTLYYACIVEDAARHEGLKSVVDDIPDFAFGLISMMSERLE